MGCGVCDNFSRSETVLLSQNPESSGVPIKFHNASKDNVYLRSKIVLAQLQVAYATDSEEILLRVAQQLFNSFHFGKKSLVLH